MAFRDLSRKLFEPSRSIQCSHILATWVDPDDLRNSLRLALDGGEVLRSDLWHPFRVPRWYPAATVGQIELGIRTALSELAVRFGPPDPSDWYGIEIGKVLDVFAHGVAAGQGVVSFLQPPMDASALGKSNPLALT